MIAGLEASTCVASVLSVRPSYTFHVVALGQDRQVTGIQDVAQADMWINGGYFVLRPEIFDHIGPGEDLVVEPFKKLIAEDKLLAYPYEGFWAPMDTLKDKHILEALISTGDAPWRVWEDGAGSAVRGSENELEQFIARELIE